MFLYAKTMNFLFGWNYAIFVFGRSMNIRRIYTNKNGDKYCVCYGTLVTDKQMGWRELL